MSGAELAARLEQLAAAHGDWRDHRTVNLNAATNSLSPAARAALGGSLAEKGISSGVRSRHHHGGRYLDAIERAVIAAAAELFDGADADLRPPTGSLANAAVLAGLVPPGATVLVGSAASLGHFSLRAPGWGRLAGRVLPVPYRDDGVDLDAEALAALVERERPALIVLGSQAMMFPLDLAGARSAADRAGSLVVYDAAHPLGLIAGGAFQRPLAEGADLLVGSTQKSLPGPVGGLVVARDAERLIPVYDVLDQLMSNYQNNRVLALGIALAEMQEFGATYAHDTLRNARVLAQALADEGLEPMFAARGHTRSNLFIVPWGDHEQTEEFGRRAEQANLIVSTTRLPGPEGAAARFGLRIGVQDVTRHGMGAVEMQELATLIGRLARDPGAIAPVGRRMSELAEAFVAVRYRFGGGA